MEAFERTKHSRASDVLSETSDILSSESCVALVKERFIELFPTNALEAAGIPELQRRHLRRLKGHWRTTYSAKTCFGSVVHSQPEHRLACGHRLCRACVKEGDRSLVNRNQYTISRCPLCDEPTGLFPIGVNPDWAGIRAIVLGGGGCRGIIQLIILAALEQELKMEGIVAHMFDFVVGTSIGEWAHLPPNQSADRCSGVVVIKGPGPGLV